MRLFTVSDLHVDYDANARWMYSLSSIEYRHDVLIVCGDISHSIRLVERALKVLCARFKQVLYVPGNHELWISHKADIRTSFEKFGEIAAVAANCGVSMEPYHHGQCSIVPLFAWYDYSFGSPSEKLLSTWRDFHACVWPPGLTTEDVTYRFMELNQAGLRVTNDKIISFSHFVPRIDVMPAFIPNNVRYLYPILGTRMLEAQIRRLGATIHVYGHSHVNRCVTIDGTTYINNAFGYPAEGNTLKSLLEIPL
jgi:predicted phosphodiesterase